MAASRRDAPNRPLRRESAALAGAIGVAAAGLSLAGAFAPLDAALYDRLATRLMASAAEPEPLSVIVAIDEPSFADLGLAWPWPRDLHARLVEKLRAAGARTIALDIVFSDPGDPVADAALASAMGPDVVLAADLETIETPQGRLSVAVDPLPALTEAGARPGLVSLPLDPDGSVRALPPVEDGFAAAALGEPPPPPGALIRYAGPPGAFPQVSFYQALEAERMLPPGLFAGKIALVGLALRSPPENAATVERFRTPWTARGFGLTPGVEIHAHAVETLARGAWIAPAPRWLAPSLALVMGLLAAFAVSGRAAPAGGAVAVGLALTAIAAAAGALAAGWWAPPAAPALAALAAGVGQSGLDHARERRARRALRRAFAHYLSAEMVDRLARDPSALRLGGERRRVTILFCDLRGFTTLSETMKDDPEALTALVNRALTVVADAILERDGMVDKFIGDCAMGVWNAPLDTPGHARRAIEAGVAAVEGVARLSAELAAEAAAVGRRAPPIACGVGINTGDCVVGNMGSARRFDYTALGDPVNLAARLETLTKAFGVPLLLGEAAAEEAGFDGLVEIDEVIVKGRAASVRVFTATALWSGFTPEAAALQAQALLAFRKGDLPAAAALWRALAASVPDCRAYASVMIDRCAPGDEAGDAQERERASKARRIGDMELTAGRASAS